jgi:trimethylamine-N-oxide reductase (cytochrome c)
MIWTDTPCRVTCWNDGNGTMHSLRNPEIEFIVAQHPWLENDCLYADIILPSNTHMEVEDIVTNIRQGTQITNIALAEQAIEPIGESKSDFEVVVEVAKQFDMEETMTEGESIHDMQKAIFGYMGIDKLDKWEDFVERKYYLYDTADDWEDDVPGMRKFHDDPVKYKLPTPSGKLEFYSEKLATHFPQDQERGPLPKWIERSESHDERLTSERSRMFPLLLQSNHGRWRVHAQCDDITWTREAPTMKVRGYDGYMYEPCWIHTSEAEKRGIRNGDIVKVFNERGIVLAGAYVTERLRPGVAYMDHGARADAIIPGQVDRGGAINTIAPRKITSKNCVGNAVQGYLVQVERLEGKEMDQWRKDYPEAFERKYDPAAGLRFDAWVEGGDE